MAGWDALLGDAKSLIAEAGSQLGSLATVLRDDPELAADIIRAVTTLVQNQYIRIDENVIESQIEDAMFKGTKLTLNDFGICGLASNRLLIYGEATVAECSFIFRTYLRPKDAGVVWDQKRQNILLTIDGPSFDGKGINSTIVSNAAKAAIGLLVSGVVGTVVKIGVTKVVESLVGKRLVSHVTGYLPACNLDGKDVAIDVGAWSTLRELLAHQLTLPGSDKPTRVREVVQIERVEFDRGGVLLHLGLSESSGLVSGLKQTWGIFAPGTK